MDTDGYGSLGSDMTESSGVFTFPSTGYWLVQFQFTGREDADGATYRGYMETTTNNSTYSTASEARISVQQLNSTQGHNAGYCSLIFDVTSTSNCKIAFYIDVVNTSIETLGNSGLSYTSATFIKLGDT